MVPCPRSIPQSVRVKFVGSGEKHSLVYISVNENVTAVSTISIVTNFQSLIYLHSLSFRSTIPFCLFVF